MGGVGVADSFGARLLFEKGIVKTNTARYNYNNMKKSENTRKYIIEKVAPVFNKKGFTGTYLSDMEKATGLTKGSIYGNFKDK